MNNMQKLIITLMCVLFSMTAAMNKQCQVSSQGRIQKIRPHTMRYYTAAMNTDNQEHGFNVYNQNARAVPPTGRADRFAVKGSSAGWHYKEKTKVWAANGTGADAQKEKSAAKPKNGTLQKDQSVFHLGMIKVGDRVRHELHGDGKVKEIVGDNVTVTFETKDETVTVLVSTLRRVRILAKECVAGAAQKQEDKQVRSPNTDQKKPTRVPLIPNFGLNSSRKARRARKGPRGSTKVITQEGSMTQEEPKKTRKEARVARFEAMRKQRSLEKKKNKKKKKKQKKMKKHRGEGKAVNKTNSRKQQIEALSEGARQPLRSLKDMIELM